MTECNGSAMKNYIGVTVLILVALLAEFSPLLHVNLGLDVQLHDGFFVIPFAKIIFWLCIVVATGWLLLIGLRRRPTRPR
jgi:hypothetical protein